MARETIVALSSGAGKAGLAVVRMSGPGVRFALETIAGAVPEPRRAALRRLTAPGGDLIDNAIVLFFRAPKSFTGEDVAEFHVHGGRAVIGALVDALLCLPGTRLAERGEFTRRGVENGRFDLTTAEGIADLVGAETAAQRRQALRQAGGALALEAEGWRGRILQALAYVEAEIDFPDEEDVPRLLDRVRGEVAGALAEIEAALAGGRRGERLREGAVIVIAGPPNAGKSTLLNALARRDVAIVAETAGTTRDAIEVHLDLDGYPATVIDTAGLRETADRVEQIGIGRALKAARAADLLLWLTAPDARGEPPAVAAPILQVRTKADLFDSPPQQDTIVVSAVTGLGLGKLAERLATTTRAVLEGAESALVARARHRQELSAVAQHLRRAGEAAPGAPIEFLAEDLRLATRGIGRLTGRVDVDEIYDLIFREFCIGK
jgi:tRNA modification GTPase